MPKVYKSFDFIPPIVGERLPTPDGIGTVKSVLTYREIQEDRDFDVKLRSRLGDGYQTKYFKVTVELKNGDIDSYHSWEILSEGWDPDRDIESCWRYFGE